MIPRTEKSWKGALSVMIAGMLCAATTVSTAEEKKTAEEAQVIDAAATVESDHPEMPEGVTCNDCHEIKLDARTTATEVWLTGDYLKWKAGEGIMPQEKVWQRIVEIFKGKNMKRTFVLATSFNNRPYTITADFALDPEKKVLYAFHEKGTAKLFHIRKNPYVSMNWHREFDDDFANTLCFQVLGTAELFEGTDSVFDQGLNVYPYEYAAKARKISLDQWKQIVKKEMIMSRITISQITLVDGRLARSNYRTSQRWARDAGFPEKTDRNTPEQ